MAELSSGKPWGEMTPEERQAARDRLAASADTQQAAPVIPPPRVPRRFDGSVPGLQRASFETYQEKTRSMATARKATTRAVERIGAGEPTMLALIGPQGTGKSHLLYAAAFALHERFGLRVYCRPWYRLADELRYGTSAIIGDETVHREAWQVRDYLFSQRIVLLDELRPTSGTDLDATELSKFACHAYDEGVSVLVTTNWATLAEVMGGPAASRFVQMTLEGPDHRQEPIRAA